MAIWQALISIGMVHAIAKNEEQNYHPNEHEIYYIWPIVKHEG